MNKKHFFLLSILAFSTLFIPNASADEVWVFHFEKSGGKLQFDSQSTQPITVEDDPNFSVVEFSKKEVSGEYRIELFDTSGASAIEASIPTQDGKFTYEMPSFTIINAYKIYVKSDNRLILEGRLDEFVLCNNNQVCEFEKGETINTCLPDCASGNVTYSPETKAKLDAAGGTIRDEKTGEILLKDTGVDAVPQDGSPTPTDQPKKSPLVSIVLFVAGMLLIAFGIVYFIRRRR